MCGITGIVLRGNEVVPKELLQKMTDSMFHRGPDEDGIHIHANVGIGMRRLSIMDVAGGSQPLYSQDATVAMVGNGEIYNYRQLQKELSDVHIFRTTTDMEVVAPLYQKFGLDFPKRMEGMFGLAILDKSRHKLHLVRDQMGVKPLFYSIVDDAIIFSSDINSILASGKISTSLNQNAVSNYFNYRFGALGNESFFNGINSLFPGQILTIDTQTLEITSSIFHDSVTFSNDDLFASSETELIEELDKKLRASVSKRLMADVPLGTLLSSGIDSTLLTAIANDINSNKVDAFTISYAEKEYDESLDAKESADHLGIKWHSYSVSNQEYTSLIVEGIRKNEAPITHPNSLSVHIITKIARENGYKVLLSGEGADELFAGYGRTTNLFHLEQIRKKYPDLVLKFLSSTGLKFDRREAAILKALSDKNSTQLLSEYFSVVDQDFIPKQAIPEFMQKLSKQLDFNQLFNHILQVEQRSYLHELLLRQDKMSMWSSMEVRVPFVGDPNMVSFANQVPIELKLKDGVNKYLLRKVAEKYLPKHICYRKKRGFGSPIGEWLRQNNELKDLAYSLTSSEYMDSKQRAYYEETLNAHVNNEADNYEVIWKMMNYLVFRQEYKF